MRTICLILLSAFLTAGFGQQLVSNGGFEDGLDGWTQQNSGSFFITCDTSFQTDPDYEVRVYKSLAGYARVRQTVELPSTLVRFSVSAKLRAAKGTNAGYYAYAAVVLYYLNAADSVLGKTMIVQRVGSFNPVSDSFQHIIEVVNVDWQDHVFVLGDELASIPGVHNDSVAKVMISLESAGNGSSG